MKGTGKEVLWVFLQYYLRHFYKFHLFLPEILFLFLSLDLDPEKVGMGGDQRALCKQVIHSLTQSSYPSDYFIPLTPHIFYLSHSFIPLTFTHSSDPFLRFTHSSLTLCHTFNSYIYSLLPPTPPSDPSHFFNLPHSSTLLTPCFGFTHT